MSRFFDTKILLFTLLLLVVIFESTSACGRRRHHYRPHFHTTTSRPRYHGKRSVDELSSEEIWQLDYDEFINLSLETFDEEDLEEDFIPEYADRPQYLQPKWTSPRPPQTKEERAQETSEQIEKSLPVPITSCGKILCTNSPNYPAAEITNVIDEAQRRMKAGLSSVVFNIRGLNLQSFESKIHERSFARQSNDSCRSGYTTTFPLEGYDRLYEEFYYVINLPGFSQGVCTRECERNSDVSNYQAYTEEKLIVLPMNQREFKIQDLRTRRVLVPHDCPIKIPETADSPKFVKPNPSRSGPSHRGTEIAQRRLEKFLYFTIAQER